MKRFSALVALIVATLLAACGSEGGGGSEPSGDPIAEADATCIETQEAIVEVNLEQGYDSTPEKNAEKYAELVPLREQAAKDLAAIEPPADGSAEWDAFIDAYEQQAGALADLLDAFRSGDEAEVEKAQAASSEATDRTQAAAEKAGLTACARVLPEEDRTAAEDALREFVTTNDPETSCEYESADALVTETYVEEGVGGIDVCTEDQKKIADDLPTDIKVLEAEGVEGVSANITFEDVGGKFDGEPITAVMIEIDGGWRLHQFVEAA